MKKTLSTMSEVFNLLDQEGSQKSASSDFNFAAFQVSHPQDNGSKSVSFSATGGSSSAYQRRDRPVCTFCGRVGHIADRCYKKHGYPASFKSKFKGDQSSTPVLAAVTATDSTESTSELTGDSLSADQIQQLVAFISSKLQPPSVTPTPEVHSVSVSSESFSSTAFAQFPVPFYLLSFVLLPELIGVMSVPLMMRLYLSTLGSLTQVLLTMSLMTNLPFLTFAFFLIPLLHFLMESCEHCWNRNN